MMINDISSSLPVHKTKKYSTRRLDQIQRIVIHHTVGEATIAAFAKYHISLGWPGIGYHYIIEDDGKIYQVNKIDRISYHVSGKNTNSVGIAFIGNYNHKELNSSQKSTLRQLTNILKAIIGDIPIVTHKSLGRTDCPGKNIIEYLDKNYG